MNGHEKTREDLSHTTIVQVDTVRGIYFSLEREVTATSWRSRAIYPSELRGHVTPVATRFAVVTDVDLSEGSR